MNDGVPILDEVNACLDALSDEHRIVLEAQIATRLTQLSEWDRAETVLGFPPRRNEVDLDAVLRRASREGKRTVLLRSPADIPPDSPGRSTLALVPGCAFDRAGRFLERGDRSLRQSLYALAPSVVTVGVGFSCQLRTDLNREIVEGVEDAILKIIVTESESCFCRRSPPA